MLCSTDSIISLLLLDLNRKGMATTHIINSITSTTSNMNSSSTKHHRHGHGHDHLKSVWILTAGSRGDVQPYIAVAETLIKRGITVRFYAPLDFVQFVESFGITAISIGISVDEELRTNPRLSRALGNGSIVSFASEIKRSLAQRVAPMVNVFTREIEQGHLPDLCISTPLIRYAGYHLAINYQVPFISMVCHALIYNPSQMIYGYPTLPYGLHYFFQRRVIQSFYEIIEAIDRHWNSGITARYSQQKYTDSIMKPNLPVIVLEAKEFAHISHGNNLPPMYKFVGMPVVESDNRKESSAGFGGQDTLNTLKSFLSSGSKPIYLGFGSMFSKTPEYMTLWTVRALRHSGQRGIILGGWAKMSSRFLQDAEPELVQYAKDNILFVPNAPHEWLFPQVSLIVHHGGAGTTHASLRAGVPVIITPVLGDQFDNSKLVNALKVGYGFSQQLQRIHWQELGDVITRVLANEGNARRVAKVGCMLQMQNGAGGAVDEVLHFWNDFVLTGIFSQLFPGDAAKKTTKTNFSSIASAVVLLVFAVCAIALV